MSLISFGREVGIDLSDLPVSFAIEAHLERLGLSAEQLDVRFEPSTGVLRLGGCAASQDVRERIVLCCGNVRGVGAVDDRMTVTMPSEVSRWRFVQPGETLARIAQDSYRDAGREPHLRAANQPLIGDGSELQPGWLLRVPAA